TGWGQGVCAGDFDNDGRSDLLITYFGHNVLYHNLGGGKFADVTAAAHLPVTGIRWGAGCTFLDYDRDGNLDLFVSNYVDLDLSKTPKAGQDPSCNWKGLSVMCGPTGLPKASNVLYHNNGDGTFTDVSVKAGILKPGGRYGLTTVSADFNNDGWPDIYVACDMSPSLLYENHHDGTFIERGQEAGVAFNADGRLQAGMGVAVADYDANGFLDIAKTNFSGDLPSLFNNEDGKFFTDVSLAAGVGARKLLGWGALFIDVDEDGWPDLMLNNGHVYPEVDRAEVGDKYRQLTLLYRNLGNGRFASMEGKAGEALNVLRPARGMAAGDLDGDGHPEIVIVNMNETPSLLKNIGTHGNVLLVKLTGTKSNRSAIGARVTVETGSHKQLQEVMSGSGFFSQNDFTLHFGLGTAAKVDRLTVRWPTGAEQEFKNLAPNQTLTIREGELEAKTAPFRKTGG
ncbi:MAG: CRTAC1 family protein, partial [Bryobacteraceae bacterium]